MTDDQGRSPRQGQTPKRPAQPARPAPRRPQPKTDAPRHSTRDAELPVAAVAKPATQLPAAAPDEVVPARNVPKDRPSEAAASAIPASAQSARESQPMGPVGALVDNPNEDTSAGFFLFTAMPSWLASTIVHVIVLLLLAMVSLPQSTKDPEADRELVISNVAEEPGVENLEDFQPSEDLEMDEMEIDTALPTMDTVTPVEDIDISPVQDISAAATKMDLDPAGLLSAPNNMLTQTVGAMTGTALSGRGQTSRQRMVREGGGTSGSEAAVMMALEWLAQHQLPDGGWNMDHQIGPCRSRCGNPGEREPARFGATGLALLPFLGAGNTHQEGPYKEVVARGLQYLVRNIKLQGGTGRLYDEGNYYSHGLCTIALCEAFALTQDKSLMAPGQSLVNEIIVAQDRMGGGWRYSRGQAGDTSVLGWLVMGLKSADMAYLQIDRNTLRGAESFLDSVQHDNGARYRYQLLQRDGQPGKNASSTMSAVGLLVRMYMGWQRENEVLQDGVERLVKLGPSTKNTDKDPVNMYYNYYATQVLHHFYKPTDPEWEKWNEKMRDFLVEAQQREGHAAGSWHFKGDSGHAKAGGRLYATSLATMVLEVYYRHMPLYRSDASEEDFQL